MTHKPTHGETPDAVGQTVAQPPASSWCCPLCGNIDPRAVYPGPKVDLYREMGYLRLHHIIGNKARGIQPIIPVSKSTWWDGVKKGRFPEPLKLSPRVTVWRVEDIRRTLVREGLLPANTIVTPRNMPNVQTFGSFTTCVSCADVLNRESVSWHKFLYFVRRGNVPANLEEEQTPVAEKPNAFRP